MSQEHHHHQHPVTTGVDALSLDLLAHALSTLTDPHDRKSCRLASRAFTRAESLSRRTARPLTRDALPHVLRLFPSLTALDLSACAGLDAASLALLPRSPPPPRQPRAGQRGGPARAGRAGDGLPAARGPRPVAVGCPGLERLSVRWCREISDIGVHLLANKCRNLRTVDVSYLKVSNESLRSLSTLEKLQHLAMVSCSFIDDDGLQLLSIGGSSLQSIDVSRCDHVTAQGLTSLIAGHNFLQKINAAHSLLELDTCFLSKLPVIKNTLTVLRLDGLEVFSSSLQAIGASCKNLVEIGLSKCNRITDAGIVSLVNHCKCLRTIDITCCHLLTDDALASIAENCRRLECIRLESCPLVSEKGLERIGTLCSHLKEIDLTDCCINDAALQHLSRCSELLTLKLGLCPSISDKGLGYISSTCSKLMELDIYRCGAITDDGLAALAGGCKKMRMLNLRYCDKITDAGLKHLSSLEELTNLEMRCLVRVTGIGIASIATGCPNLKELDLKRCYSVDDASVWAVARYSQNLRQLDISYCQITGLGLCHLLSSLRCLQDLKMVHLSWVSIEGFEMALRAACGRLKKVKMLSGMRSVLSPELLQMLQACGCRVRWIDKPLVYK
ncbi:hypothetical protein PR202_ga22665 [Eleusine coracana subsp. coracana]|uniref:F-box/LRR-repeat protein 15-like leucin rich repeat domain-containing protein n=1 Tax=Eleusine coracana subsp. coracana TaxID=191504 RepID=A0AAV5D3N4_ELECO|nr:hypothetical protein PR202_ga22665 [Eleusine coracana subsp. coracana]